MATFTYTAIDRTGKRTEGTLDAADRRTAQALLEKSGRIPVSIKEGTIIAACKASTIPSTAAGIWSGAFCFKSPISIVIPASFSASLSANPFNELQGLTSIEVESGNEAYDSRDNCKAIVKTATNELLAASDATSIPDSVTKIGYRAFTNRSLESVEIGSNVKTIDAQAFLSCPKLTSVKILPGAKEIGSSAFGQCPLLSSFEMPNTVTKLDTAVWNKTPKLTSITYKGTSEEWEAISKSSEPFNYSSIAEVKCSDKTIPIGQ